MANMKQISALCRICAKINHGGNWFHIRVVLCWFEFDRRLEALALKETDS